VERAPGQFPKCCVVCILELQMMDRVQNPSKSEHKVLAVSEFAQILLVEWFTCVAGV
jgi:hypothetical protein